MNDVSGQHNDVCDVFLILLLSNLRRISSIYCQDAFEIVSFIRRVTRIYSSLYKPSDSRTTKIGRESLLRFKPLFGVWTTTRHFSCKDKFIGLATFGYSYALQFYRHIAHDSV